MNKSALALFGMTMKRNTMKMNVPNYVKFMYIYIYAICKNGVGAENE
jgi:hypothetical protein